MPSAAPRPCTHPGCGVLVHGSPARCPKHPYPKRHVKPQRFEDSGRRPYNDPAWIAGRRAHLAANPLCGGCVARGFTTLATEVDHIRPHRGDRALFFDRSNWQSLCRSCHARKTAQEDGGFGNTTRRRP